MDSAMRILLYWILPLLLEACAAPTQSPPPNGMTDTESIEVRIRTSEFEYHPKIVSVQVGRPVHLVLDNSHGTMEHDLSAPALGLYL